MLQLKNSSPILRGLRPRWAMAANWKRRNNYCLKSDGGDTGDSGKYGTPLGLRRLSGSQWVHWEFFHCRPVGTQWDRHMLALVYFTKELELSTNMCWECINFNSTHSHIQKRLTRTHCSHSPQLGLCESAKNKWRRIGGSLVSSEEQLVLRLSSSADFNWQSSLAWRP